jgi:SpoVK/Ycf46/Vps4 family AAA+-type ATPase
MTDQQNLESALRSHFPIIVIETHEEKRAIKLLRNVTRGNSYGLLYWTAGEGLRAPLFSGQTMAIEGEPSGGGNLSDNETTDPEVMLKKVRDQYARSVVVLVDFHPYLTNPTILRLTKEIALGYENRHTQLVLISHSLDIPPEIKRLCMRFELTLPDVDAIRKMVVDEAKAWSAKPANRKVKADRGAMEKLVNNMLGLTTSDARRFIRTAIHDDGAITHSDVEEVMTAKYELVSQTGALSFEYDTASFGDVGGFKVLKQWLDRRKRFFLEAESEVDIPKGVLLLGVQGCGKSLASKAIAGVWGIPLLRLDTGALYNKYIGETEKNIRTALKSAETLSPCVLWIDEIEKGIDTGGDDNGTSRRMLGTLLTWMAENTKRVFIVATANDISSLPPELIRKGRMDEIFFVDLPDQDTREEILRLHLQKRDMTPEDFDIQAVAEKCDGFSGAELEQVVVSARYAAHADAGPLNTSHLLDEVNLTRPLSVVMAEDIAQLRAWAAERTVSVD